MPPALAAKQIEQLSAVDALAAAVRTPSGPEHRARTPVGLGLTANWRYAQKPARDRHHF